MDKILKLMMPVANVIFLVACVVHVFVNGYYELYPDLPSIRVLKKSLHDIDFPLAFTLCISEISNSLDRYRDVGYLNYRYFFKGKSMYNSSLHGWSGHTENGSTIASVEGKTSLLTI